MTGLLGKSGMEPEKRPFPRPGRNRRQQKPPKAFQDWRSLLWEMEHDPELLLLTRRMEQEYQDRTAGGPRLDPERTLLFHSRHSWVCNFLTAPYFRRAVRRAFQWASERGFTTFLADYGTPFGLLALEELSNLRRSGFRFSLYAVRSVHMTQRKSYRLRRDRQRADGPAGRPGPGSLSLRRGPRRSRRGGGAPGGGCHHPDRWDGDPDHDRPVCGKEVLHRRGYRPVHSRPRGTEPADHRDMGGGAGSRRIRFPKRTGTGARRLRPLWGLFGLTPYYGG